MLASNLINTPLPNFKMLSLERYDGSGDPDDRLPNYKIVTKAPWSYRASHVYGLSHHLTKAIEEWFNNLLRELITSSRDLAHAIYNQFAASKKRKKNLVCLLSISQTDGEKLRDFIN